MSREPFMLEEAEPPRAVFARYVSDPLTSAQRGALRDAVERHAMLVLDLTGTMTLSTDWWRWFGQLAGKARRSGGRVVVVGANSVGLRTADRVGVKDNLEFVETLAQAGAM